MTATNHAVAGAIIASFMPLPIAIPVAIASHFVLDVVPHYGIEHKLRNKSSIYKMIVFSDTALAVFFGLVMALMQEWTLLIGAAAGFFPDVTVVYYYFKHGKDMDIRAENKFMRFHLGIQHEYPGGIYPELLVFAIMLPIFVNELLK